MHLAAFRAGLLATAILAPADVGWASETRPGAGALAAMAEPIWPFPAGGWDAPPGPPDPPPAARRSAAASRDAEIRWLAGLSSPVLVLPVVRRLQAATAAGDEAGATALDGRRAQAARLALFAYLAMRANAPLCNDITSPDGYLHDLGSLMPDALAFVAGLDAAGRRDFVDEVLALEAAVDPAARDDTALCRRGMWGDRYCPSGPGDSCPAGAAPFPEFATSVVLSATRQHARLRARAEVRALAGPGHP